MLFFNADGSMGEMCGNGARCIARFGYEEGLAGEEMVIETTAGPVSAQRLSENRYRVRLNDVTAMELNRKLTVDVNDVLTEWDCAYVELGNPGIPHLAVEYRDLEKTEPKDLWALGSALRHHKSLPKGANVNFYEILEDGRIFERTFERGVEDFTYACGTGTGCAAAVLAYFGKVSGNNVKFNVPGGNLYIDIEEINDVKDSDLCVHGIFLTGPTNVVIKGEITDENLPLL